MLNAASLSKEIYQHHTREKRTWSPSPGFTEPSNTTYSPSETIGGLKVPKTKKVMTRRSSTSMNRELDERLRNLPSPGTAKGHYHQRNTAELQLLFLLRDISNSIQFRLRFGLISKY